MIFEKIRERLQEKENRVYQNFEYLLDEGKEKLAMLSEVEVQTYSDAIKIINQVEAEYNNDVIYQLAMKYALCLTQYGVDITEKLETATQNAMALEKAYIRGRQDECDRFSELRDRHNNGWISVDDRLPEKFDSVLVSCEGSIIGGTHEGEKCEFVADGYMFSKDHWQIQGHSDVKYIKVLAWQTLPEPYTPKGE